MNIRPAHTHLNQSLTKAHATDLYKFCRLPLIGLVLNIVRMKPFEQRVIKTKMNITSSAYCLGQITYM